MLIHFLKLLNILTDGKNIVAIKAIEVLLTQLLPLGTQSCFLAYARVIIIATGVPNTNCLVHWIGYT